MLVPAADAAGEVRAGRDHVPPSPVHGVEQVRVAGLGGDVDGTRIEVQLPDDVARDVGRLAHGQVILPVRRSEPAGAQQPMTASIDVQPRELEVACLAGRTVELDQGHLDLRVAVDPRRPVRPEGRVDRIGGPARDRQEPVIAQRPVPGDPGLDQVADAVQLVAELEVLVLAARREDLDERVQVPVLALGRRDRVDRLVGHRRDTRIPGPAELPGDPLEPLVHVRVEERERPIEHDAEGLVLATCTRGEAQVVQVARLDELAEDMRQRLLAVHAHPFVPQPTRDVHVLTAQGAEARDRAGRGNDHRHGTRDPGLRVADADVHRFGSPHLTAPVSRPDT